MRIAFARDLRAIAMTRCSSVHYHFVRLKELSTDYYEDYYKLSSHDGKTWIAPKVLIREDVGSSLDRFC